MVLDTSLSCTLAEESNRKHVIETKERDVKRKNAGATKRAGLMDVRVIQRHLVYAVGLAAEICEAGSEQVLRGPEYFGKYGKIKKISVTWNNNTCPARQASAAAYVLYHTEEEAWNCIQAVDGVTWSGKQVRACYGTTKYCHSYLRKATCNNPDCSYLHEPAPEEDTVTKDEMNPITGRKDILHLVHPGGTPRSRSKKSPPCPVSKAIDVPPASAAAVSPDGPSSSSPSKSSPGWAIPAPNGHDAIDSALIDSSRDSGSVEDSPQFVISANTESAAWPALSESIPTSELPSDTFARPSAKDVVTGTASTTDAKDSQWTRMMPLSVPSRPRLCTRPSVTNPPSMDQHSSSNDEHALSTMPSSELFASRPRPDTLTEAMDIAPTRTCLPPDDTPSTSHPPTAPEHQTPPGLPIPATTAPKPVFSNTGERLLSALDLLPAALEDALEGSHSLPRAPSRDTEAPTSSIPTDLTSNTTVNSTNPSPAVPVTTAMEIDLASIQHRPNRKQSRFAFVQSEATSKCTSTSLSPAKDLVSFTDAPAFTPSSNLYQDLAAITSDRRQGSAPPGLNNVCALDSRPGNPKPREPAYEPLLGLQQPRPRSGPTSAQSALDHPPMTHESVVQAVSAQLQAMLQGGTSASSASLRTTDPPPSMLPMSTAPHHHPSVPAVDHVPPSDLHLLQALLQQEVSTMSEASHGPPQSSVRNANMSVHSSMQTGRQGLAIKRPSQQIPQPMAAAVHPGMPHVQYPKVAPHNGYVHQRNPGVHHERAHRFSQGASAHVPSSMGPTVHPSYAMSHRGMPYVSASAALAMEQSLHQARTMHHVPRYSEGGYAMDAGAQYAGWETDMYNNMISALQAQQQRQQMAAGAAAWHTRAPGGHWE